MRTPVLHPLAPELGYCAVVPGFLTPPECRELIALAEAKGFRSPSTDYPPTYRTNDRLVHDDERLSRYLFQQLRGVAPSVIHTHGALGPESWRLDGVNERLRFCRYTAQQQFNIHQDGVHHRAFDRRSMLTFMIYLTDGEEFSGSDTEFFAEGPRATPSGAYQPEVVLYRNDGASSSERTKHQGYVWTLARLSTDSFASGGRDCSIRIWDGTFRQPAAVLTGHAQSVLGLAALDATRLASVSRDRTLRFWSVPSARCTSTVVAHEAAALTVLRLDDDRVATGSADHKIKIWSHAGREIAVIRGHGGWVWKLVRVNQNIFASASEDGTVNLWHARTYAQIDCSPGTVPLRSVAASPDGRRLVTGDVTGRLRVWVDLQGEPRVESEYIPHRGAIRSVMFLGANTIASGGEDYRMHIWRDRPWRSVYQAEHDNFVTDIVALDAQRCASASCGGEILVHQ